MLYYENVNDELKNYFLILCGDDYPLFIEKYLDTKELKRISKVGQFCGCDYTKLHNINSFTLFENASHLERTDERPLNYHVSLKAKKRYVMPLCNYEGINYRLEDISDLCKNKIDDYMVYKDSMYSYVANIKDITLKKENR